MIRVKLAVALVFLGGPALSQTLSAPPAAKTKPAKLPPNPLLADASGAVARSLKDPSSAQFQNVRARDVVDHKGRPIKVVCGEVNAKNSFGGFTGYAPWIYLPDMKQAFLLGPDRDIVTVDMLKSYCS